MVGQNSAASSSVLTQEPAAVSGDVFLPITDEPSGVPSQPSERPPIKARCLATCLAHLHDALRGKTVIMVGGTGRCGARLNTRNPAFYRV